MVEIRRLDCIKRRELEHIMPGYRSTHKYAVSKSETPEQTTITLKLVALDQPYVRSWAPGDWLDIERYQEIVKTGLSLGAYDGNELVGVALAERHDWNRTLWVWEFGVAETHRRQGIGRRMMDALADLARSEGLRVLLAETQNTNVPAITFYRAAGFEIDAVDLSYYSNHDITDFEVAIFMKRKLRSGVRRAGAKSVRG